MRLAKAEIERIEGESRVGRSKASERGELGHCKRRGRDSGTVNRGSGWGSSRMTCWTCLLAILCFIFASALPPISQPGHAFCGRQTAGNDDRRVVAEDDGGFERSEVVDGLENSCAPNGASGGVNRGQEANDGVRAHVADKVISVIELAPQRPFGKQPGATAVKKQATTTQAKAACVNGAVQITTEQPDVVYHNVELVVADNVTASVPLQSLGGESRRRGVSSFAYHARSLLR